MALLNVPGESLLTETCSDKLDLNVRSEVNSLDARSGEPEVEVVASVRDRGGDSCWLGTRLVVVGGVEDLGSVLGSVKVEGGSMLARGEMPRARAPALRHDGEGARSVLVEVFQRR